MYIPPGTPHWVHNGPDISLSVTLTYFTAATVRENRIEDFNSHLRRRHLNPREPGHSAIVDTAKVVRHGSLGHRTDVFGPPRSARSSGTAKPLLMERATGWRGVRQLGLPPGDGGSPEANAPDRCLRGLERRRLGDASEPAHDPLARYQPEHLSMVRREPSLIGLLASEEVHFAEASSTGVVDDGGEQDGRGIPPAGIGEPGALIQAHPAGHLERRHGRDHQVVVPEFVDDHLVGRAATSESGREAIEDGKEAGAASPLGLVEFAQGVEALAGPPGPGSSDASRLRPRGAWRRHGGSCGTARAGWPGTPPGCRARA